MFDISLLDLTEAAPALNPPAPAAICICCNCDRVRTRSGKWASDPTLLPGERRTHGICPECFAVLYPEFASIGVR
jgi:hypothetical protein